MTLLISGIALYALMGFAIFVFLYDDDDRTASALIAAFWPFAVFFALGVMLSGFVVLGLERARRDSDDELE